ncbi:hypothetical protein ACUTAH_24590 [Metapseudomonas furukawaii]|uniref:hypothetical protein n=1 Tax=Metapseudomonas furukawaii TaxID=1149133 RepID=UPI00404683E9
MSVFKSLWFRLSFGFGLALLVLWWLLSALHDAHDIGYGKGRAESAASLESLRAEHAQAAAAAARKSMADAKAAAKHLAAEQARVNELAGKLAAQQRDHRTTTDRLIGEITRVNDLYRKTRDVEPEPLPACVFTRGFVRLWDEATGALPTTADSSGAAAQGAEARALEQLDAGIGRAQLLAHHIRFAEQCRDTAAQLDALIDAVQVTP